MTWPVEIRDVILERIANGESVKSICDSDGMPSRMTLFRWIAQDAEFRDRYARAKEESAELIADEILDIADDGRNDWIERNDKENAGWVFNGEAARRSQIRIDARKWLLAKLAPKKYGDRIEHEHKGGLTVSLMPADKGL